MDYRYIKGMEYSELAWNFSFDGHKGYIYICDTIFDQVTCQNDEPTPDDPVCRLQPTISLI